MPFLIMKLITKHGLFLRLGLILNRHTARRFRFSAPQRTLQDSRRQLYQYNFRSCNKKKNKSFSLSKRIRYFSSKIAGKFSTAHL